MRYLIETNNTMTDQNLFDLPHKKHCNYRGLKIRAYKMFALLVKWAKTVLK